jgi:hypothetical protein
MHSTLKPKPTDDPHDILVVAPDVVRVAPADQELSNVLQVAARILSDAQTRRGSDVPAGPPVPPVDTTFRPAAVNNVQVPRPRWSIGRGAVRALAALLLAACIGVASFAWRAYGDAAEKKIAKWATQFVMTVSLPLEKPGLAGQTAAPAVQAAGADAAPAQPAPPAESAADAVAPSSDSAQLLQSMARDLASLGQEVGQLKASIEQLKTGQQQMSRDAAKVSEVKASEAKASEAKASEAKPSEPNARPRTSALPPRPTAARARKPMPPYPAPQAAAAPALPPATAPYPAAARYYPPRQTDYVPRQVEPQSQLTGEPLTDPELSSVPRPPMPVR